MHALYEASSGASAEGGRASKDTHSRALISTHRASVGADVQLLPSTMMACSPTSLQPGHVNRCPFCVCMMQFVSVFFWGIRRVCRLYSSAVHLARTCDDVANFSCSSSCTTYLLGRSRTGTCVLYVEQYTIEAIFYGSFCCFGSS